MGALSLYRADHGALYEILLYKRIDTDNRNCCKYDTGCLQDFRIRYGGHIHIIDGALDTFRSGHNQIVQLQLQGP